MWVQKITLFWSLWIKADLFSLTFTFVHKIMEDICFWNAYSKLENDINKHGFLLTESPTLYDFRLTERFEQIPRAVLIMGACHGSSCKWDQDSGRHFNSDSAVIPVVNCRHCDSESAVIPVVVFRHCVTPWMTGIGWQATCWDIPTWENSGQEEVMLAI